jgi:hypothetical protein
MMIFYVSSLFLNQTNLIPLAVKLRFRPPSIPSIIEHLNLIPVYEVEHLSFHDQSKTGRKLKFNVYDW